MRSAVLISGTLWFTLAWAGCLPKALDGELRAVPQLTLDALTTDCSGSQARVSASFTDPLAEDTMCYRLAWRTSDAAWGEANASDWNCASQPQAADVEKNQTFEFVVQAGDRERGIVYSSNIRSQSVCPSTDPPPPPPPPGDAYWINSAKSLSSGCGTSAATACPSWIELIKAQGSKLKASTKPDTINFVAGDYNLKNNGTCVGVEFQRTASSELTIQCSDADGNYAKGQCTIRGGGETFGVHYKALVMLGSDSNCNDKAVSYIRFQGFNIKELPVKAATGTTFNASGITFKEETHHVYVQDVNVDGTIGNTDNISTAGDVSYITFVNVSSKNCSQSSANGCMYMQSVENVAIVGGEFGQLKGFPSVNSNKDGISFEGVRTGLIDGTHVHHMSDGIDISMFDYAYSPITNNVIVRYNDTHDFMVTDLGTGNSHNFKISGSIPNAGQLNHATGDIIEYKNVARFTNSQYWVGGFWLTEATKDTDLWYNTVYGDDHNPGDQTHTYFYTSAGLAAQNTPSMFNLVTGTDPAANAHTPVLFANTTGSNVIGNGFYFPNRGSAPLIKFNGVELADLTAFNNADQTGVMIDKNFYKDPGFPTAKTGTLSDYKISSADYIDKGDAFCKATSAGSASSSGQGQVSVTCQGSMPNPGHYFPNPANFYALTNDACKGQGNRAFETNGNTWGCYDIQIAGCGVVTITSMSSNLISFRTRSGGACSWSSNAMVHVPWNGNAPDVGALEH